MYSSANVQSFSASAALRTSAVASLSPTFRTASRRTRLVAPFFVWLSKMRKPARSLETYVPRECRNGVPRMTLTSDTAPMSSTYAFSVYAK